MIKWIRPVNLLWIRKQESQHKIARKLSDIYNKRLKNLRQDFQRDEFERMQNLKDSLRKTFGGTKADVDDFIEKHTFGTTDEVIRQYPNWLGRLKEDTLPY